MRLFNGHASVSRANNQTYWSRAIVSIPLCFLQIPLVLSGIGQYVVYRCGIIALRLKVTFECVLSAATAESAQGAKKMQTGHRSAAAISTLPTTDQDARESRKTLNVALADRHPIMLEGLRHLLDPDDFCITAEVTSGRAAVDAVVKHNPELLILDIRMPDLSGRTINICGEHSHGGGVIVIQQLRVDMCCTSVQNSR
jgi:Response regulator receiver domain